MNLDSLQKLMAQRSPVRVRAARAEMPTGLAEETTDSQKQDLEEGSTEKTNIEEQDEFTQFSTLLSPQDLAAV